MPDETTRPISVLVVDDHTLFRQGLARLLSAEDGFDVRECGSIELGLQALAERPADVVLLDLDLGNRRGEEFLPLARQRGFSGKVLVVAAVVRHDEAAALIRQGVSGIVTKSETALKLAGAIREVAASKLHFDPRLLEDALDPDGDGTPRRVLPFTARERAVLGHVFEGLTNKEIGDRLGVSESAVKATLQQLFAKTGVRTRSQLVRIALERYKHQL